MSHRLKSRASVRGLRVALIASSALLALAGTLLASVSAQATTLPALTLSITSSSITVGGATQSGAVNVVSTATGVKEANAILVQLRPGVTVAELEAALKNGAGKDPNKVTKYGLIVFDAEVSPGKTNEAQMELEPAQYVALAGEGEGSPKFKDAFTVTAAASPATLPTPEATIRSIEFDFRGPTTLRDGELVRFEDEGYLVHMDIAFPAKSKQDAKLIVKGLLTGKEKGLEKLVSAAPFSFTGPVSHEAFQQETITAKPGWYVQACFMATQEGVPHTRLGMERIIKIVK
jgi:hypothetical protein